MTEENKSRIEIETYWWNKELFHWRNKQMWLDEKEAQNVLSDFKLYWTLTYFSFCCYWLVSISAFASSVVIPLGIRCSSVGLKYFAITVVIKKCKSIIKKKKKKHGKIVLLSVRTKLNTIEVLISGALMYSYISHEEFFLANNVLKENHDVKEDTKNLKTSIVQQRF